MPDVEEEPPDPFDGLRWLATLARQVHVECGTARERLKLYVSIGTLALLAVYTAATLWQACLTRRALSAAERSLSVAMQTLETSQRAELAAVSVGGFAIPPDSAPPAKKPTVEVGLQNAGHATASRIVVESLAAMYQLGDDKGVPRENPPYPVSTGIPRHHRPLAAGDSARFAVELLPGRLDSFLSGARIGLYTLYISGTIRYHNGFKPCALTFCWRYDLQSETFALCENSDSNATTCEQKNDSR